MSKNRIKQLDIFLIGILSIYCFFGKYKVFTIFGISTDYLFWILIAGTLSGAILQQRFVQVENFTVICFAYILYSTFEMLRGNTYDARVAWIFIILSVLFMLYIRNKEGISDMLVRIFLIGGCFYSITVILQWIAPGAINAMREAFLSSRDFYLSQRGYENTTNYMSGLAMNATAAAFFICFSNVIFLIRVLYEKRKIFNGLLLAVGLIALLLTQKRMLLIASIIAVLLVVIVAKKNLGFKVKFLCVFGIALALGIWFAIENIPAMQIMLDRMFNTENVLSGREVFYEQMWQWFKENPLIGVGIGTANATWGYGGHNCYIQLLAETGIIGAILYALIIVPAVFLSIKRLRLLWNQPEIDGDEKSKMMTILFATISIVIICIYAISGNPFYDYIYCLTFYSLLMISKQVSVCENGENI